jgi:uncharacterized membrane protein YraQ (UPF0718 family)
MEFVIALVCVVAVAYVLWASWRILKSLLRWLFIGLLVSLIDRLLGRDK